MSDMMTFPTTDKNVGTKISREPLELARAIDGLTEWQKHVQTDSNINRDISIAIETLKAQLGTNLAEVGTDCISRQAVIDAFDGHFAIVGRSSAERFKMYIEAVINDIRKLPPAQLGTNLAEVGTRAVRGYPIDADALMEKVEEEYGERARDRLYQIIRYMPPAQPEIIRCKDCKYRMPYDWMFSETWQSQNMDDYPEDEIGCLYCDMAMKADDYCSRAEKKVTE